MSEELKKALVAGDHQTTQEQITQMVRDGIAAKANEVVNEDLDRSRVSKFAAGVGGKLAIGASLLSLIVAGPVAALVAGGASAIAGFFVGLEAIKRIPALKKKLFNAQLADEYDELIRVTENRDRILAEFQKLSSSRERNEFEKRTQGQLRRLTRQQIDLSRKLREDIADIGDDLEINDFDRRILMNLLEKGEKGAISDILSDK